MYPICITERWHDVCHNKGGHSILKDVKSDGVIFLFNRVGEGGGK